MLIFFKYFISKINKYFDPTFLISETSSPENYNNYQSTYHSQMLKKKVLKKEEGLMVLDIARLNQDLKNFKKDLLYVI